MDLFAKLDSEDMRIGIIGTAGRREDADKLSAKIYARMIAHCRETLYDLIQEADWHKLKLVSGGAAYADHLAVHSFLEDEAPALRLYLPAEFKKGKFVSSAARWDAGSIANYYHKKFSDACNLDSLREIALAIEQGAEIRINKAGFKARNLQVARYVDYLIAYTFGEGSIPKDGGTLHTWKACPSSKKHYPIDKL